MTDAEREAYFARDLSEDELDALMFRALRPGIMLNKTKYADDPGAPGCWLGGEPTLPPEIDWPIARPGTDFETPMHFLAQVNLASLPRIAAHPEMPRSGTLFFFVDWIFAPLHALDADGVHKVIYVEESAVPQVTRKPPSMPKPDPKRMGDWYAATGRVSFKKWNFDFLFFEGLRNPSRAHPKFEDRVNKKIAALTSDVFDASRGIAAEDMLCVQTEDRRTGSGEHASKYFAAHHLFGSLGERGEPEELTRLLAIKSDYDLGFGFWDDDWLAFFIDESNLRSCDFDKTQLRAEFA